MSMKAREQNGPNLITDEDNNPCLNNVTPHPKNSHRNCCMNFNV